MKANRPSAVSRPLLAPVGGWNRKDALDAMKPEDAVILENFFPRQSDVIVRSGYDQHCDTGEGSVVVGTLAEWKSGTSRKLVAAVNGKLIDVTSSVPSTIGTGYTNNRWRTVNFGERLFLVNGSDSPLDWDGTTLTVTAWVGSGLTNANLSDVCVFKERLFFVEKNTLNFWYADLKAITNTLTKFPLKYTGQFGGTLQAVGTISSDGGAGPDDMIAFYLSSGEVVVYAGSDPGDATSWALVGRYNIGAPIGSALVQYGSDLVAITEGAYVPLTKVIPFGRTQPSDLDLSDRISEEVTAVTGAYGSNTGWQAILYPRGRKLIFNVPRSAAFYDQHVMNLDTKRWCKFTGWNFRCFVLFNDQLYGGGTDGKVYRVDYGLNDDGDPIVADGQTAWNYFGMLQYEKNFSMVRVNLKAVSDPGVTMSLGTDFDITIPTETVVTESVDGGAIWDTAIWDTGIWGGSQQAIKGWQGTSGQGYCASMRMRVSVSEQAVAWQTGNIVFSPCNIL